MEFKNPFIFDNRPIPAVTIRFRSILNSSNLNDRKLWTSFISRLMREEKSRFKYSQISIIREEIRRNPDVFTIQSVKDFVDIYMKDPLETIDGIFGNMDIDTKAFVLGMSGFNIKDFYGSKISNCKKQ